MKLRLEYELFQAPSTSCGADAAVPRHADGSGDSPRKLRSSSSATLYKLSKISSLPPIAVF